jgi:cytoskeletal protein RodZ
MSSREKILYWVIIAVIVLGGGGALAYYFFVGRPAQQAKTSVTDIASQSIIDIPGVTPSPTAPTQPPVISPTPAPAPTPTPTPAPQPPVVSQPTTQPPVVAPSAPVAQPAVTVPSTTTRPSTSVTPTGGTPSFDPTFPSQTLAAGTALPTETPTSGAPVLLLSGITSLSLAGAAAATVFRRNTKPKKRARKARR